MSGQVSSALRVAAAVAAFGALASCATLNKEQCQSVNWAQLGQEDGMAGRAPSYLDQHRRACAEHKLPVDEQQWSSGWELGIRVYCTPENGLLQGREGKHYANSCPIDLKTDFDSAYSVAKALYDARASRDRLQSEMDTLHAALRKTENRDERRNIEAEIDTKGSALRIAERRLWDAEGDYDLYVRTNGLSRY